MTASFTFGDILTTAAAAVAGQPAGPYDRDSGVLDVDAPAGVALTAGTATNSFKLPTSFAEAQAALGVNLYNPFKTPEDADNGIQDGDGDEIDICRSGLIWAVCEEACTPAQTPYCRYTANGTGKTQLGAFRNDADFTCIDVLLEDASPAVSETWALTLSVDSVALGTVTYTNDASPTIKEAVDGLVALVNTGVYGQHVTAANVTDTTVRLTPRVPGESVACTAAASGGSATATVDTVTNTSPAESCCAPVQARFRSTSTGAGVVQLQVNFPG